MRISHSLLHQISRCDNLQNFVDIFVEVDLEFNALSILQPHLACLKPKQVEVVALR